MFFRRMNDNTLIKEINSLNFERGELMKLQNDQHLYTVISNKMSSSVKAKQLLFKVFCWSKSRDAGNDYRLFVIKYGGLKASSEIEISDKVFGADSKTKYKIPPISRGSIYLEAVRSLYKSCNYADRNLSKLKVTSGSKLSKKALQIKTVESASDNKEEPEKQLLYDAVKEWIWENLTDSLESQSFFDIPFEGDQINGLALLEDNENLPSAYSSDLDESTSYDKQSINHCEVDDTSSGNLPLEMESRSETPTSRSSSSPVSMDENSNTSLSASCKLKLLNFEKIRTRNQGRILDPHTFDTVPLADHADDSELQSMSACGELFCNMGCICDSISTNYSREETCGLIECVFSCSCTPVFLPANGSASSDSGFITFVAKRPKRNVRPPSKIRDFAVVTNFQTESTAKSETGVFKKKRMYLLDPEKLKASRETPEGGTIRFRSSKKMKEPSKKPPLFASRKSSQKKTVSRKTIQSKVEQSAIEDGKKLKVVLTKLDVDPGDDLPENKKRKLGKAKPQTINSQLQTWLLRRQQSDVSSLTLNKRRQAQKLLAQASPFVSPVKKVLTVDKKVPLKHSKANKVVNNTVTLKSKAPKSKASIAVPVKESNSKSLEPKQEDVKKEEEVKPTIAVLESEKRKQLPKTSARKLGVKARENRTASKLKSQIKSRGLKRKATSVVKPKPSGVSKNRKFPKPEPENNQVDDHIDLILDASDDEQDKDSVPLIYNKELFQFSSNSLITSDTLGIKLTVATVPESDNHTKPLSKSKLKQNATSETSVLGNKSRKNKNSSEKAGVLSSDYASEHWQLVQENLQLEIGNQKSEGKSSSNHENLPQIENTSPGEEQLSDTFEKKYPFMARAPPKTLEDRMKCARVNSTNFLLTCARCRPVSERFFMKNAIRAEQNDILVKWRENLAENSSAVSNDLNNDTNFAESDNVDGNRISEKNESTNNDSSNYTPEDFAEFKSTYVYLNGNRVEIFSNCNWSSKKLKIYERVLKNMENPQTFKFRIGVFCVEIIDNLNKNLTHEKMRHDFDNIRKIVVIKYKLTVDNDTEANKGSKESVENIMAALGKDGQTLQDEKNHDKVSGVLLPEELLNYDGVPENASNDNCNQSSKPETQQISKDVQGKPRKLIILSKKEDYAQFAQQKAIMTLQAVNKDLAKVSENPENKEIEEKLDKDIACDETFDHSLYTFNSGTNSKTSAMDLKEPKKLQVESHPKIVQKEVVKLAPAAQSEKQTNKLHRVMKVSVNSLLSEKDKQYSGKVVKSSEIAKAISQRWHSQKLERKSAEIFERNKILRAKLHANSLQNVKPSLIVAGQRNTSNSLALNPPPDQQKPIVIYRNITDRKRSHDSGYHFLNQFRFFTSAECLSSGS